MVIVFEKIKSHAALFPEIDVEVSDMNADIWAPN
jgi:hypothetical protein